MNQGNIRQTEQPKLQIYLPKRLPDNNYDSRYRDIVMQNINYNKIKSDIINQRKKQYRLKRRKRKKFLYRVTIFSLAIFSSLSYYKIKKETSRRINQEIPIEITNDTFLEPIAIKNINIESGNLFIQDLHINNDIVMEKEEHVLLEAYQEIEQEIEPKMIEEPIKNETVSFQEYLPNLGNEAYDEKYSYVEEHYGDIVDKYASIAGIDPRIIKCILAQERGIHSSTIDRGGAIGIAQIQVDQHVNSELTLHNYKTGEDETFTVTSNLLKDVDGNIKVGVALLQTHLYQYNGNIFLALQAYNYGEGATNSSIRLATQKYGYSKDYVINNPTNLSWLDGVETFSQDRNGYGDEKYLDHVLSRYPGNDLKIIYYSENEQSITLDLNNQKSR